ncbi:MAG: PD40 domain-containing protein [Myxococcales bacterium]|nr:PD40 domain-containing protein [Myxococcales bacterium]
MIILALILALAAPAGGPHVLDADGERVLVGHPLPAPPDSDVDLRMRVKLTVGGAERAWPLAGEPLEQARLLPGGGFLATLSGGALVRVDAAGARTAVDTEVVGAVGASPDGRHLVYTKGEAPDLEVWQVSEGGAPRAITRGMAPCWSPAVSPDGRRVVFTSAKSGVPALWIAEDGAAPRQLTNLGAPDPTRLSPFPNGLTPTVFDGARVAFEADGRVHVVSAAGVPLGVVGGRAPHWGPDGRGLRLIAGPAHRATALEVP